MGRKPKEKNGRLRAVGYVRVSTQEQGEKGVSLSVQTEKIEAFCVARDWHLVKVYSDKAASGKDLKRKGLTELRRDAKDGAFEAVVVLRLDRLSRRMFDFAQMQEEFRSVDVALVSIAESFDDTTPIGRAMANIILTFASLEREMIAERTRETANRQRGKLLVFAHAPYGFRNEDGRLVSEPKKLKVVEEIFSRKNARESLRSIARELNEREIPSPRGVEWSAETIRVIIRNAPTYGKAIDGLLTHGDS